jgi:glucose-6-phosphate isomerase
MKSELESGFRLGRPPHGGTAIKRYKDSKWVQSMTLSLNHNYAMADFLGEGGLKDADLDELTPRLDLLQQDLATRRASGQLAFMELPYQTEGLKEIRQVAKPLSEWCWDLVVLGVGGSALGARALHQALRPPQHNKFPMARRNHKLGLWVTDNIDPDYCFGLLDGLDMRRVGFNVVSKSGHTMETLAQFQWAYQLLKNRLGEAQARERLIITTDPENGPLRSLARQAGLPSLPVPPDVGGRFSVLSAVGLLPAALTGIDLEELLAGARFMDQRLKESAPDRNPAFRLAALWYLFATVKHCPILVFMPYANALGGLADWFGQLWAESLGKQHEVQGQVVHTGSTPVKAMGSTDLHSQFQLYMAGPADKLITFLAVDKFEHNVEVPDLFPGQPDLDFLGGQSLNELIRAERQAAAFHLMQAGRPNLTLHIPEVNPFTVGQLIYLLEVATVAAGFFYGVNAFDQPEVAGYKRTTYGLLGRKGYEKEAKKSPRPGQP